MTRKLLVVGFSIVSSVAFAQPVNSPKLVVGIVVDQMRQEYIYRFERKFGDGGFKRLMSQGYMLKNAHYNYVPTYTGPGHASVYTGTTPAIHGIIGNDWYDKNIKKGVNCVGDDRFKPVGSETGNGDVSPCRMLSTTISDELEISTQRRAKVVGISMKDRGAVLPAGHTPDGAYWFDGTTGKFITSTYYKPGLPTWLEKFNAQNLAERYLSQEWKTTYPIEQYKESGPDDSQYETKPKGKERATFPYNLKELRKDNPGFDFVISTPFGNDLLADLAIATIDGEAMGKDEWTDMLTVSFSSPDYVGHAMGPQSIEVEDIYIRLDKTIETLLAKLDASVGKGQYVVFLTADHAVAEVPAYLKDLKIPGGNLRVSTLETGLKDFLKPYFPDKEILEEVSGNEVFLNSDMFNGDPRASGVDFLVATELIRNYLLRQEGIAEVYTRQMLLSGDYGEQGIKGSVRRGFHTKRSGDLLIVLEPGWIAGGNATGTTHGSAYTYDTHVPILFFGMGVKSGSSSLYHTITDIAPTISVLLKIKFPSGCTGQPVAELLEGSR
ncbi:MAG TPA: alkaline phosphatase PafA [Cyclobacteriaceae bacterium]|nr:alkaline phosphatase PafA [Cyclobacteriaceae bacterium]